MRYALPLALAALVAACDGPERTPPPPDGTGTIRIATFNTYLNRAQEGQLLADLRADDDSQIAAVAEIIQRVRPDIILLNEFDYDPSGESLAIFREKWLKTGHNGADGIDYPYYFSAPSNTGEPSGRDLDRDGKNDGPGDAQGFGVFPGQYGMALLSRYPIDAENARTFRTLLWKDMPGALLPDDPRTEAPGDWYDAESLSILRLSSKSHWDVPVQIGDRRLHVLAMHPTPPAFDGPEDRNGRRNHDEIRLMRNYIAGDPDGYIKDDKGVAGGLAAGERFVILGDLNADPLDGARDPSPIMMLLDHPLVQATHPESAGGAEQARIQDGINAGHRSPPERDTSDFRDDGENAVGNLRLDYVLPSRAGFEVVATGVFWPTSDDPLYRLTGDGYPVISSDHRLVHVDLQLAGEDR
ncbi:MAG: endonuclease/exonuclease/phosphatase family protein [Rhodothalassiaceae bacterium]